MLNIVVEGDVWESLEFQSVIFDRPARRACRQKLSFRLTWLLVAFRHYAQNITHDVRLGCYYRVEEGHRESILSRNAISRTGDGLPSNAVNFLHVKIAADADQWCRTELGSLLFRQQTPQSEIVSVT
jgi:hypothetical protein